MIREADPADYRRLSAIQRATLDERWPELLDAAVEGAPLVLVADGGARDPVGYALVVPGPEAAYLAELAVTPPEQGRGHGTALVRALVQRLRADGVDELRLSARADDPRVRSFYEGLGFSVRERLPDHYEDGDAVLYVREL